MTTTPHGHRPTRMNLLLNRFNRGEGGDTWSSLSERRLLSRPPWLRLEDWVEERDRRTEASWSASTSSSLTSDSENLGWSTSGSRISMNLEAVSGIFGRSREKRRADRER